MKGEKQNAYCHINKIPLVDHPGVFNADHRNNSKTFRYIEGRKNNVKYYRYQQQQKQHKRIQS